jgi:exonuclease III
MRIGEARVAKRLDVFLISKSFLDEQLQFIQWDSLGGDSDHGPIILELAPHSEKPIVLSSLIRLD